MNRFALIVRCSGTEFGRNYPLPLAPLKIKLEQIIKLEE